MPPAKGSRYADRTVTTAFKDACRNRTKNFSTQACPEFNRLAQFRKDAETRRHSLREAARARSESEALARYGAMPQTLYALAKADARRRLREAAEQALVARIMARVDEQACRVPINVEREVPRGFPGDRRTGQ